MQAIAHNIAHPTTAPPGVHFLYSTSNEYNNNIIWFYTGSLAFQSIGWPSINQSIFTHSYWFPSQGLLNSTKNETIPIIISLICGANWTSSKRK